MQMKHLSQIIFTSVVTVFSLSSCSLLNDIFNKTTDNSTLVSKEVHDESANIVVKPIVKEQEEAQEKKATKKTSTKKNSTKKESASNNPIDAEIPSSVINGNWTVCIAMGKATSGDERPYIIFDEATKTMYANNGCNTLNAEYKISNGNIEFINMLSTQRYCHDAQYEMEINQALANAKAVSVKAVGNEYYMTFLNIKNEALMTIRKPNLDFINGTWKITKVNSTSCKNKNIELALDIEDLKVHGNVGCNIVNGSLLLDASKANSIMFLDLISTMKSCPDLALETEILMALEQTEYYKKGKDDKILFLCDKDNNVVLELTSTTENYIQDK